MNMNWFDRRWRGALAALLAAALLSGCASRGGTEGAHSSSGEVSSTQEETLPAVESPRDLEGRKPADFGCLVEEYPTQYSSYQLLPQDPLALTVHTLTGSGEGPSIYIVGGTHGDELAGWYAGLLLQKATLRAGTVYLVAPVNQYGAEHNQRKTREGWDLNRAYPGDQEGTDAQRIAAAIYQDIADKQPALVLDLHEAILHTNGTDNLGNSIICQDMSPIADLVLGLLSDSESGTLPLTRPLTLYGSPPEGSLNRTVTLELGIPVITVETFREEALNQRVSNQLHIAEYVLMCYNIR